MQEKLQNNNDIGRDVFGCPFFFLFILNTMSRPIKFLRRFCKLLGRIDRERYIYAFYFIYAIIIFALENNTAFNSLFKSKNKLTVIHFIRMQLDCCLEVYACLLYKDKDKFFKFFKDGKPINKLTIGKQQLTTSYLCGELDKRYPGIVEIYKEGCKWIHPNTTLYRYVTLLVLPDNASYIGYKGKKYSEDKEELKYIYKDMLLVNQILYKLLKELVELYKYKHPVSPIVGKLMKTKRKIGLGFYE